MVQILFYFIERPLYKVKSSGRIVLRQRKMLPESVSSRRRIRLCRILFYFIGKSVL